MCKNDVVLGRHKNGDKVQLLAIERVNIITKQR